MAKNGPDIFVHCRSKDEDRGGNKRSPFSPHDSGYESGTLRTKKDAGPESTLKKAKR